jgi:hypothetical protein
VSKFVLTILFLLLFFSFSCTRVVTIPVRTVVDWTEETKLSSNPVFDLTQKGTEEKPD